MTLHNSVGLFTVKIFWLRNRPPKSKYHFFGGSFSRLTSQSQAGTLSTLPPFTAGTGTAGQRCFSPWGKCFCDSPQNLFHRLSIAYTTMFSVQKKLHLKGVLRRTTLLLFTSGTETEMLFHPGESCFAIPPGFTLGDIHCCSLRSRPNT